MVSSLIGESSQVPSTCHGFCGRYPLGNSTNEWTDCGACAWGSRAVDRRLCSPCESDLSIYDWMFLAFMAILPLIVHCFCVHWYSPRKTSRIHELAEHLCCILECLVASTLTLLVFPPRGSFRLWGCSKSNIKEWYPELYNPIINYTKPMRCSYEVVFPLYSMPFAYLLCLLFSILIFRSVLYSAILKRNRDAKAYYYALLSLPKVAIIHALLAGMLYHSYPYLVMLWSISANAIHLAMEGKLSIREIIKDVFTSPIHIVLLIVNMALFAFALIALTAQKGSSYSLFSLMLVPVPPVFYILTIGLSHPSVLADTH